MTRVDENREARRAAEQRRLEEQQKAKQRQASEGQLARAFAHKGLTLERLAVTDS